MLRWSSNPPADCPFEPSRDFTGITFTGRHAEYTNGDTWYPTWSGDGHLYSPWTDGEVNGVRCVSDFSEFEGQACTAHARIIGDDPLRLRIEHIGLVRAMPQPYGGRYPCGSLVHNGVWYYGTYCLDETDRGLNWDILGPFIGFRISRDYGQSWQETSHTTQRPIFGESGKLGHKVRIGAPHFVDFGKNLEHSPDGKAYLVSHGASKPEANLAWISGDQAYLMRVAPTPESINSAEAYEFFAGHDETGAAIWSPSLAASQPLFEWINRVSQVSVTFNAPLGKYLMCVTDGWPTIGRMNTYIIESNLITGPWRLVSFMRNFGEQAYFVSIPSKFINGDGKTAWLCYAANFTNNYIGTRFRDNPPGSRYGLNLQEFQIETG